MRLGTLLTAFVVASAGSAAALPTPLVRPLGRPDALVDLRTAEGAGLMKGQWRYADARIVEVEVKGPGPDLKPPGAPVRTYDYTPRAGAADFDDSAWQVVDATRLDARR